MNIPPAAGVGEAINFQAADSGNVATTGDFVLVADEVNPVRPSASSSRPKPAASPAFFMSWCS